MNKFCVIGLGDHARTKIIPAIKNLKDAIKFINRNKVKNNSMSYTIRSQLIKIKLLLLSILVKLFKFN